MNVFGLSFHPYGLIIGLGFLAGGYASSWLAKRRGVNPDLIWDGLWWVLIPALIGARLYHVFDLWSEIYAADPLSILFIWNGGLGIFGGIIGGFLGIWMYYKLKIVNCKLKIPAKSFLDLVMFGLPLGQAIGRVGNFINQEVYGLPTALPWGIYIKPENRLPEFQNINLYHPLFAYEAILNLLGFAVMLTAEKKNWQLKHYYLPFYLIWYGAVRFGLEFLRPRAWVWGVFRLDVAQIVSIMMVISGIILYALKAKNLPLPKPS